MCTDLVDDDDHTVLSEGGKMLSNANKGGGGGVGRICLRGDNLGECCGDLWIVEVDIISSPSLRS